MRARLAARELSYYLRDWMHITVSGGTIYKRQGRDREVPAVLLRLVIASVIVAIAIAA